MPNQTELDEFLDDSPSIPDGETHSDPGDSGEEAGSSVAAPEGAAQGGVETPTEEEWVSIRDAARTAGIDLSKHENDEAALEYLIDQTRRANEYQRMLADQQAQFYQQAAEAQRRPREPQSEEVPLSKRLWDAPEYDPTWLRQVTQDENGAWVPVAGVDPSVVGKLRNWATWQQQAQERFFHNPVEFLMPAIREVASEIADGRLKDYESRFSEQQTARDILSRNEEWMIRRNPDGSTDLTEEGQIFKNALEGFHDLDSSRQFKIGMLAVEAHRAAARSKEATAAVTHQQRKKEALAAPVEPAHAPQAGGTVRSGETQNPGQSLADMLTSNFKAAGITDEMIAGGY